MRKNKKSPTEVGDFLFIYNGKRGIERKLKNFLKKIKKIEKVRAKQLDLNFVSYYNK